jgi:hypothetical protein
VLLNSVKENLGWEVDAVNDEIIEISRHDTRHRTEGNSKEDQRDALEHQGPSDLARAILVSPPFIFDRGKIPLQRELITF